MHRCSILPFALGVLLLLAWAGSVVAEDELPDRMLVDFDGLYQEGQLSVEEGAASLAESGGNRLL